MTIGLDSGESFESMYDLLMANGRHSSDEQPSYQNRDFVVIRHGDTSFTEGNKAHGWSKEDLTPEGKKEIENINLKDKPDLLVASDLPRTEQTAKIISKTHGIPLAETTPELRTWDIGKFQGLPCEQADKVLKNYVNNPDIEVPGGESFNDFKTRVIGGVEDVLGRYPDAKVGMVTHSKVQKLLDSLKKGNFQHIDAEHFNEGSEAPGKEKSMKLAYMPNMNDEGVGTEGQIHNILFGEPLFGAPSGRSIPSKAIQETIPEINPIKSEPGASDDYNDLKRDEKKSEFK